MFDQILLEPAQERLLADLVEATRAPEGSLSRSFYTIPWISRGSTAVPVRHPGLAGKGSYQAHREDIEELGRNGLLNVERSEQSLKFDVSPLGFRYYEELRRRQGEPAQRVIAEMRHHVDSQTFRQRCGVAYQKWELAESLLWGADSQQQLTVIGHHCREALQEFIHQLTYERDPSAPPEEKAKTVARARALLDDEREGLGDRVATYLEALLNYWGTLIDLVQRQEHGGTKEGQPLVWVDARRIVVGTLIVMTEFAQAIPTTGGKNRHG